MNEAQLHEQRVKAKAFLRQRRQLFEDGQATAEQLAEAERHFKALMSETLDAVAKLPEPEPAPEQLDELHLSRLPAAVLAAVEELREQQNRVHAKKAELSNSLRAIPDTVNALPTVKEILRLREEWRRLGDERWKVAATGVLPVVEQFDPAAYRKQLPNNADALRHKITDLQSNIKKAEKRLAAAKGGPTQQRNEIKIAQWRREVEQMKLQLSAL
ncbi:MAG: hypothetical protein EAZ80_01645 [Runella slithyformis]|nr:MAG: hypothetical protein EAZ80_01645 [Runella slithyformis]TAF48668.1 MAG: hypothetical protein EAZ63_03710 [Runella slithyformis]